MELKQFITDTDLEREGVWFDLGEGLRLKIARQNTPEYRAVIRRLTKPYKRQILNDTISDDKMQYLLGQAYSECILKDWEGLTENGKTIAYSKQKAFEILTNPAYHEFRNIVGELSQDATSYRENEIEELSGNSASLPDN